MSRYAIAVLLCMGLMTSCSLFKKKDPAGAQLTIRYMNLKAAYDFALNRNRDALDVRRKIDARMSRMRELEGLLENPKTDHVALLDEYRTVSGDLNSLKTKSRKYKVKLLSQVNRAVKNVSNRIKADFIFNIGDELIYAKKEYDVTEDILRELVRVEERGAPEAR